MVQDTLPPPPRLQAWCNRLAHAALPSDQVLLQGAGVASGHPWAFLADLALADPGSVAYYRYLYGLARLVDARNILEIGTAFGLGSASFILGSRRLQKLISLDLGVFTKQYEIVEESGGAGWQTMNRYQQEELVSDGRNIDFAREALGRLVREKQRPAALSFYRVNTQPEGSDNFDAVIHVPRWFEVPELVKELEETPIDLLFIDGKHTGDGLYQDFKSFFPFVRPGGVILCDDLHDASYPYAWAGQTVESFERATTEFAAEIEETHFWAFAQLPDWYRQEPTLRPWGLVRKRGTAESGDAPPAQAALLVHEQDPALLIDTRDLGDVDRDLRFLKEHRRLFAELESQGLTDAAAARLHFMNDHAGLFADLEQLGLAQEAAPWLHFVKENPVLFRELAAAGLSEEAVRRLRFVKDEYPLFAAIDSLGFGARAARLLRFANENPALLDYLIERPALSHDLERYQAEAGHRSSMPNVAFALQLVRSLAAGTVPSLRRG
jgi:predicted O-methyltransferase YrrM